MSTPPLTTALAPEQAALVEMVDRFGREERPDERFPEDKAGLARFLGANNLLGLTIPEEYGGQGASYYEAILALQTIAQTNPVSAQIVQNASVGQANFLKHLGTDALRERYLPLCSRGDLIIAISITEPDAGSAASALRTTATPREGGFVINGEKVFISASDVAGLFIVYARFGDRPGAGGIGAVVVEPGTPGFVIERQDVNMADEQQGVLRFEDCWVPEENVLISERAFSSLMGVYTGERLGAIARVLGVAQGSFAMAVEYVKSRRQFNRDIADFQGVQWMLADMKIGLDAAELLVHRAAAGVDRGLPNPTDVSIAKVFTAETAQRVCDNAIQLHGGYGYMKSLPLERRYREVRGSLIYGGTVQVHRNMIAASILERRISQWAPSSVPE